MKPRFAALDLARLLAVLMMIQGHAMGTFVVASAVPAEGAFWTMYMPFRGLTASTFLLISGLVNFVGLSRDENGRVLPRVLVRRARRGVALILIDYFLTLPVLRLQDVDLMSSQQWYEFLRVGTLNLIGMALLLLTLLMALTRSDRAFARAALVIGSGIVVATPWVHQVNWFALVPPYVGHYLTLAGGSHFAIFPHAAYLFLGAALGPLALRWLKDARPWTFESRLFVAGLGLAAVGLALAPMLGPRLPPHDFWLSSPFLVLERAGGSLVMLSAYAAIFQVTRGAAGVYSALSRKTLHIYVAHILVIFGHTWMLPPTYAWHLALQWPAAIGATAVVIVASFTVGAALAWLDRSHRTAYVRLRWASAVVLAYALWYGPRSS